MSLAAPRATEFPSIALLMERLIAQLETTGYRIATDSRDLNPPGLLVTPPILTFRFQGGSFDAAYTVVVAAANTDRRIAYGELSEMIVNVQGALTGRIATARPVDVWASDQTAIIAAYELAWTDQLRTR